MFGHEIPRKRAVLAGAGALLAIALACGWATCGVAQGPEAKAPAVVERGKITATSEPAGNSGGKDKKEAKGEKKDAKKDEAKDKKADENAAPSPSGNDGGGVSSSDQGSESIAPAASSHAAPSPSEGAGASGGNGSSQAQHTHNWVPQTMSVHHDAQYDYVWHDAVTETALICNHCNAQFESVDAWGAHIEVYIDEYLATNPPFEEGTHTILIPNGSYRTEPVVVQPGWEEQVLVSEAWDETVTYGYVCSGCGAVK